MLKVITIGTATKDVFLVSKGFKLLKSDKFETGKGECFAYGAKIDIGDINFDTGGGATNAAATFANFKIPSGAHAYLGNDSAGTEVLVDMKMRGIDVSRIFRNQKLKTAYSTILVAESGDRTILVYRGASSHFDAGKISAAKFKASWLYVSSVAGNLQVLNKLALVAAKNKSRVFWNPGQGEIKAGLGKLISFLEQTTVISLNKEEAQLLTGKKEIKENLARLGKYVPMVWITDGKNGSYFYHDKRAYHLPALNTKAVNTTGAGDAFGSGFVAGLILKNDWQYAARLAALNADGTIREMGAKHGLLKNLPNKKQFFRVKIKKY